jgi:hypothetical protein
MSNYQLEWQRKVIREEYLDNEQTGLEAKDILKKRRNKAKKILSAGTLSSNTMNTSK